MVLLNLIALFYLLIKGVFHLGVIKSLIEQNVLPNVICGFSVGAIIAAIACTTENEKFTEQMLLNWNAFENSIDQGWLPKIIRFSLQGNTSGQAISVLLRCQ